MVDIVDSATRSRMMSGIRNHSTKPELLVRKHLHARGFRYVLGGAGLPGRPDIVLPRWKVAVFVHGCFWHWHGCSLSKMPATNFEFWNAKLDGNQTRDTIALLSLVSAGWRVINVWECSLRGAAALERLERRMTVLGVWIKRGAAQSAVFELP